MHDLVIFALFVAAALGMFVMLSCINGFSGGGTLLDVTVTTAIGLIVTVGVCFVIRRPRAVEALIIVGVAAAYPVLMLLVGVTSARLNERHPGPAAPPGGRSDDPGVEAGQASAKTPERSDLEGDSVEG